MKPYRVMIKELFEVSFESKEFAEEFARGFNDYLKETNEFTIPDRRARAPIPYHRGLCFADRLNNVTPLSHHNKAYTYREM